MCAFVARVRSARTKDVCLKKLSVLTASSAMSTGEARTLSHISMAKSHDRAASSKWTSSKGAMRMTLRTMN